MEQHIRELTYHLQDLTNHLQLLNASDQEKKDNKKALKDFIDNHKEFLTSYYNLRTISENNNIHSPKYNYANKYYIDTYSNISYIYFNNDKQKIQYLIYAKDIGTTGYTITEPGVYGLAEDVIFSPSFVRIDFIEK